MADPSKIDERCIRGLERAKEVAEAKTGLKGNTALAEALSLADGADSSISPQAVSQWTQIPLGRVFDVEKAIGVPRHDLRPDFFGEKAGAA